MSRSRTYRPRVECLEARCVPSTFTVTNLFDNHAGDPLIGGSLRKQIDRANLHSGPDTIVFRPGLEGSIKLTGGEIVIRDSVVIAGPGAAKITVDGNAASGIFQVDDGTGAVKNVTIKGLTLFNGNDSFGGAIETYENLTLVKTVITGNHASVSGGALFSNDSRVTIRASRIVGNEAASNGGGIRLAGGGIVRIENSTIAGNTAVNYGGGISMDIGAVTVRNTVVSGNSAGQSGGGLYVGGNVTDLTIANSTITGNHAGSQGGGLFSDAVFAKVTNTKITHNTAVSSGGGLRFSGVTEIDRGTISGNTAQVDSRGGGIRQSGGSLKLVNSTVSGNHADGSQGGGICVTDTTAVSNIGGSTISGNSAEEGGGVWSQNSALKIERSVISGNTALMGDGGGIAQQSAYLRMTTSTVRGNHADGQSGGGILLANTTSTSTILGSTISANTAHDGGGLLAQHCNLVVIRNSTMSGNGATEEGGGICLFQSLVQSGALTIQNSTIAFNGASHGGGIYATYGDVNLDSSIVAKNRATLGGPDLYSFNPDDDFLAAYSLIGNSDRASFIDNSHNIHGITGAMVNPLLAPLAFNGGPTKTHALKAGSPAINKGSNTIPALPFDQRGAPFKRKLGKAVDIGAFERQ